MGLFDIFRKQQDKENEDWKKEKLSSSLDKNLEKLKKAFEAPVNEDFHIRDLYVKALDARGASLTLEGVVDENFTQMYVIQPIQNEMLEGDSDRSLDALATRILATKGYLMVNTIGDVIENVITGNTVLLVDGFSTAISCGTATLEHRPIEKPVNENVIKGPKEAFIESGKVNRGLIRKQIKSEKLVTESISVGVISEKKVYMMYVRDVANPRLIEMVRKRIEKIEVDSLKNVSTLEQYIEDRPYSMVPTVLETERPDRAASFLMEGHIILIMDSSPSSLVVPVNFWVFFHTAEDHYQRWLYGNFLRLVRLIALFISLLAPSIYVAISNYHIEMIPTDLLLSIAATRERLPFPAAIEILLMEIAFELIREGGIRVPTPIGPTIGIVGALILGQAAVEANIVSPILVIIVSVTGLASFAIPEASLSLMIRIYRFIFLIFGAVLGFYGIAIVMVVSIAYIGSIKSFGVPYLAPFAPYYRSSNDTVFRPTIWKDWLRPFYNNPEDKQRKKKPGDGDEK